MEATDGEPRRVRTPGRSARRGSSCRGFDGATGWLNSSPLTTEDLRGKSSSSTSGRTPASTGSARSAMFAPGPTSTRIRGWSWSASTRRSSRSNATSTTSARPSKDMTVEYPVALDSDYAIWSAFGNRYWPAVYIADAEGRIRHHQFGEGEYEECERIIQRLLATPEGRRRRRPGLGRRRWFRGSSRLDDLAVSRDLSRLRAGPELSSPGIEWSLDYVAPDSLELNQWALAGDWTIESRVRAC